MNLTNEMLEGREYTSVINKSGKGRIVFVCEHASNYIPESFHRLGLSETQLQSHIAWDPGALSVAQSLAEIFDAPLVYSGISRLMYDCNRPPGEPSSIALKSEMDDIPGNFNLSDSAINSRIQLIYEPFVQAIDDITREQTERNMSPSIVTIHSFTPLYHGKTREVEVGILHDDDHRLADCFMANCDSEAPYVIRRNQPYGPADGVTHTLKERAMPGNLPNVMIEMRNDLIQDEAGIEKMVNFLAGVLKPSIADCHLMKPSHNEGQSE